MDYRFGYGCHFRRGVVKGDGNPGPSVMWGDAETVWVANSWAGTFDAYSRDADVEGSDVKGSTGYGCYEERVTAWTDDGSSYTTEREFSTGRISSMTQPRAGMWARAGRPRFGMWAGAGQTRTGVCGLTGTRYGCRAPGVPGAGVYVFDPDSKTVVEANGFDGVGGSNGLWSDGQAMWVATAGMLKAYWLYGGGRLADLDVVLRRPWAAPAGIWSDGEFVWVTYRDGVIDQYLLPRRAAAGGAGSCGGAVERAGGVGPPSSHDGHSAFYVRVAFSEPVEMSGEEMIAAVVSAGGAVTAVSPVGDGGRCVGSGGGARRPGCGVAAGAPGRGVRDGRGVHPRRATAVGWGGREGARPRARSRRARRRGGSARCAGAARGGLRCSRGGVDLGWAAVPGADRYEVQAWLGGQWAALPLDSTQIAFYGAGAVISGLDPSSSLWARVRAVNGHGASEWSQMLFLNATSEFTAGRLPRPANTPATGAPAILGDPAAGALWADTSGISDADGLDRVLYRYQWTDDGKDIAYATHITYAWDADDADEDREIGVRVSFTDRLGNPETLTSAPVTATAAPQTLKDSPNTPATGTLAITGDAHVGGTLTADVSAVSDADGLTNASYSYQWVANDGTADTDIAGATDSTYTLVAAAVGKTIKVRVTFTDDAGNEEELTSAATDTVEARPNSPATGAPEISGTAQVGETLTADTSSIADQDGLSSVVYQYQWLADGADIAGATATTYALTDSEQGKIVKVRVSFTDDAGNEEELTSAATDTVEARPNSPATGQPSISGTVQVGETLTADTSGISDSDGLSSAVYRFQWLDDDADIAGATAQTYTLVDADAGVAIKVRVTFTDDAGNEEELTSAATDTVSLAVQQQTSNSPATGAPSISGTVQVGETLTVDTTGIADADGLSNAVYQYQWLADDADIAGATAQTYTLVDADAGVVVKVRVSFTDDAGNQESLTSQATDVVAVAEPAEPPATPKGLTAAASHDQVVLSWDDPQDESITGYVILRRDRAIHEIGTFVTVSSDTGSAANTYTDHGVSADTSYNYRIKAMNDHGVSKRSRWARADTPAPPVPATPTGLTAAASHDRVVLRWDDPQDDSITGYVILRRNRATTDPGEFTELVSDTGSAATTYTDDSVAADTSYTYKIRAINEHGVSELSRWARADTPAPSPANSPATGAPTISGMAQVGETLTADTSGIADEDGLSSGVYRYQWLADDAGIFGATATAYTQTDSEEGKTVRVRVSFTDEAGNEETLTSAATDTVEGRPNSPATGGADDQRHGAGGRDADGGHLGHRRR